MARQKSMAQQWPQPLLDQLDLHRRRQPQNPVLSIARACRPPALTNALLDIAEQTSLPEGVRVAAVSAMTDPDAGAVERLRVLVRQDSSAEVVAARLRRLRPEHIALTDFLSCVRDPDPNLLGYAFMLRREVPGQISVSEIEEATAWATGTRSAGAREAVHSQPGGCCSRAR